MSAFLPKAAAWIVEPVTSCECWLLNITYDGECYERVARFSNYDNAIEVRNRLNEWESA